jgi:nucleoid-associated protein YgaU
MTGRKPDRATHIKELYAKVPLGEFAIDMKKFEGSPGDTVGETFTVKFTPGAKALDSTSIRLTQIVTDVDLTAKADYKWTGSEANRNKIMTTGKDESYTTTATDTLKSIALQFYGDPARPGEVYAKDRGSPSGVN